MGMQDAAPKLPAEGGGISERQALSSLCIYDFSLQCFLDGYTSAPKHKCRTVDLVLNQKVLYSSKLYLGRIYLLVNFSKSAPNEGLWANAMRKALMALPIAMENGACDVIYKLV